MLLADWPPEERCEFARLLCRFAGDICQHLDDSTSDRVRSLDRPAVVIPACCSHPGLL